MAVLGKVTLAVAAGKKISLLEGFQEIAAPANTPQKGTGAMNDYDEKLAADMARLGTRVYSEEGIPMVLACENLTGGVPSLPESGSSNALLASALQRYSEAWLRLHPGGTAADVAKLIELLADKDFASGGKDTNL